MNCIEYKRAVTLQKLCPITPKEIERFLIKKLTRTNKDKLKFPRTSKPKAESWSHEINKQ